MTFSIKVAAIEKEVDSLLKELMGDESQYPKDNIFNSLSPDFSNKNYVGQSGTYQLPVRVGKGGGNIDEGDKPWIVGHFSPNAPTDVNHKFHNGVDLKAPKGTPVHPIGPGIVSETGNGPKSGLFVKILHEDGKVQSFYGHLNTINAGVGNRVDFNSIIGTVGSSGNAFNRGSHLHIECKINGNLVDLFSVVGKPIGSLTKQAEIEEQIIGILNKYAKL